jgi:hypothetical protein
MSYERGASSEAAYCRMHLFARPRDSFSSRHKAETDVKHDSAVCVNKRIEGKLRHGQRSAESRTARNAPDMSLRHCGKQYYSAGIGAPARSPRIDVQDSRSCGEGLPELSMSNRNKNKHIRPKIHTNVSRLYDIRSNTIRCHKRRRNGGDFTERTKNSSCWTAARSWDASCKHLRPACVM